MKKNVERSFHDSVLVCGCGYNCEMGEGEWNGPHLLENTNQKWIRPPTWLPLSTFVLTWPYFLLGPCMGSISGQSDHQAWILTLSAVLWPEWGPSSPSLHSSSVGLGRALQLPPSYRYPILIEIKDCPVLGPSRLDTHSPAVCLCQWLLTLMRTNEDHSWPWPWGCGDRKCRASHVLW